MQKLADSNYFERFKPLCKTYKRLHHRYASIHLAIISRRTSLPAGIHPLKGYGKGSNVKNDVVKTTQSWIQSHIEYYLANVGRHHE